MFPLLLVIHFLVYYINVNGNLYFSIGEDVNVFLLSFFGSIVVGGKLLGFNSVCNENTIYKVVLGLEIIANIGYI